MAKRKIRGRPTRAKGISAKQAKKIRIKHFPGARKRASAANKVRKQLAKSGISLSRGNLNAVAKGIAVPTIIATPTGFRFTAAAPRAAQILRDSTLRTLDTRQKKSKRRQQVLRREFEKTKGLPVTAKGKLLKETQRELRNAQRDLSKGIRNDVFLKRYVNSVVGDPRAIFSKALKTKPTRNIKNNIMNLSFFERSMRLLTLAATRELKSLGVQRGLDTKGITKIKTGVSGSQLETKPKLTKKEIREARKLEAKIKRETILARSAKFVKTQATLAFIGAGAGAVGGLKLIFQFKSTARDIKNAFATVEKTKKTLAGELFRFGVNPVGFVAEWVAFEKTLNIASFPVKHNPLTRALKKELFIFRTPKVLKPAVRAILDAAEAQKGVKTPKISLKDIKALKVKTLTAVELKAALKAMKETKSVLFGSAAARILSKGKTRLAKDLDIATRSPAAFARAFIKNIPRTQRAQYFLKGQKLFKRGVGELMDVKPITRLSPSRTLFSRGTLPVAGFKRTTKGLQRLARIDKLSRDIINVGKKFRKKPLKFKLNRIKQLTKQLKKEVKGFKISELPKSTRTVLEGALDVKIGRIEKVGGLRLVGFSEQTLRKGLGTLQVLIERNIRRAKDPAAFVESLIVQVENLKATKPITRIGKALKNRKIKKINNAVKILTSKHFAKLLEKRVSGITKEFPIMKKIDVAKLKKMKFKISKPKFIWKRKKFQSKLKKNTLNKGEIKKGSDFHHIDRTKNLGVSIPERLHKRWHMIDQGIIKGKNTKFYKILRMRKLKKGDIPKLKNVLRDLKSAPKKGRKTISVKRVSVGIEKLKKPKKLKVTKFLRKDEFFHGTKTSKVPKILKQGLKIDKNFRAVFLTKSLNEAKRFAGKGGKVLKVRLSKRQLKRARFSQGEFTLEQPIKPTQIKLFRETGKRIRTKVRRKIVRSKLVRSKLPKKRLSRLISKIPKRRKLSKIPSKTPKKRRSKLPSKLPKKRPSKLPKKKSSKIPKPRRSRLPSKLPSKLPRKLPSRLPSKLPRKVPSKIPKRIPKKTPKKVPPPDKKKKKIVNKVFEKAKRNKVFIFIPDLQAVLAGQKATGKLRGSLIKKGRIFSGQEARFIV